MSIYSRNGQFNEEIELVNSLINTSVDEQDKYRLRKRLAIAYAQKSNYDKAIEINEALHIDSPGDIGVINNLAYALLQKGKDIDRAVEMSKKAYNIAPENHALIDTYAMSLIAKKDFVKAERLMLKAIQEQKRASTKVSPEYDIHLSQAIHGNGRTGEARARLESALDRIDREGGQYKQLWYDKVSAELNKLK